MHTNSFELMRFFVKSLGNIENKRILDIGSQNINGTYRELFPHKDYIGIDTATGSGVDIVVDSKHFYPFKDDTFDLVICGQVLEHTYEPGLVVQEIHRLLRPSGKTCIIVPWKWDVHRYPVDCYRILPDGLNYLMTKAGLKVIDCSISEFDTIGIGIK